VQSRRQSPIQPLQPDALAGTPAVSVSPIVGAFPARSDCLFVAAPFLAPYLAPNQKGLQGTKRYAAP
jgi:hypothetical protein